VCGIISRTTEREQTLLCKMQTLMGLLAQCAPIS